MVEAMVVKMSGAGETVVPLAQRLYQETEGNPFFLMEIVKALFEMGMVHLKGGVWSGDFARISKREIPLPASVSEVIQARAHRLDEDTRDALHLAAVLGHEDVLKWHGGQRQVVLHRHFLRRTLGLAVGATGRGAVSF